MTATVPVTLEGYLTDDPVFGSSNGVDYVQFSIAVNSDRFDEETKAWVPNDPVYHRVSAFHQMARNVRDSLQKGHRALVVGEMSFGSYADKEGRTRDTRAVKADVVGPSLRFATATLESNPPKVNSPAADYATGPVAVPVTAGADLTR